MTSLQALSSAAADYVLLASVLALVAAALLLAVEELGGRREINRIAFRRWLFSRSLGRDFGRPRLSDWMSPPRSESFFPISSASYALPYKQFVATISSLVQVDLRGGPPYPLATTLSEIGMASGRYRDRAASPTQQSKDEGTSEEATINFFAERAIDDLQAFLALYTARMRYLASLLVVSAQVLVLGIQPADVADTILSSLTLYTTAIAAAVLFAPILRDTLERLTR